MKKWNQKRYRLSVTVAAVFVLILMSTLPVLAAEKTYQVSFKAGSKGTIGAGTSYSVDVPYGGMVNVDAYQTLVSAQEGYYFTGWEPELQGMIEITEKTTLVAQYARIINEAIYQVNYVDTEGVPVATQKVAITNQGANVTEQALAVDGYAVDQAVKSMVVDQKKGTEISFIYTSTTQPNVVVETETVTLPGGTTVTVVGTPATATTAAATTTAGATAAGTTAAAGTTTTTTPAGATAATTPAGATTATQTPQAVVQAADETTPQANIQAEEDGTRNENTEDALVESEDEETPQAKQTTSGNKWMAWGLLIGLLVLGGGFAAVRYVKKK